MTPELKIACELVFQEHKRSHEAINWNKDSFRGRLSFGMSALAKQTLEKKQIIRTVSPGKKQITILNPAAAAACNFEEAEEMIQNEVPIPTINKIDKPAYITYHVPGIANSFNHESKNHLKITARPIFAWLEPKSSAKSFFYYFILAFCATTAGALITFLLGLLI